MIGKGQMEYEDLKIRDFIFYIYIILFIGGLYANKIEEEYIQEEGKRNPEISQNIRIVIFSVLVIIYIYFLIYAYKKYAEEQSKNNLIRLISAILILIAGILVLYLQTQSVLDEEVAA